MFGLPTNIETDTTSANVMMAEPRRIDVIFRIIIIFMVYKRPFYIDLLYHRREKQLEGSAPLL